MMARFWQVHTQTGPSITHVVAGSDGTDKVKWARARSGVHRDHDLLSISATFTYNGGHFSQVHAVSVEWLARCGYLWRAVEEEDVLLAPGQTAGPAARELERLQPTSTLAPPKLAA